MNRQFATYQNLQNPQRFRLRLCGEGILVGAFSGFVVGFFRFALSFVEAKRSIIFAHLATGEALPWILWLAVLVAIAYGLSKIQTWENMAGGSGIPQVKGFILGHFRFVWWRIIIAKLVGGVSAIGAGLSLGREGPSIQLGAMCGQGVSRALGRSRLEERYLVSSGSGAGLAAAFNAPLAGVIFTLEELHKNFSSLVLLPTLTAALTAVVISHVFFGRATIFAIPLLPYLTLEYVPYFILLGAVLGAGGAVFNWGIVHAANFYKLPIFRTTFMKIAFPLLLTLFLGLTLPEVLGGGNTLVDRLVGEAFTLQLLLLLLAGKFLFTMLSYGTGVPGGFFLPMLVIGALLGNICASILVTLDFIPAIYRIHVIVFSMAGFFASSVRSPITGIVLILEMTGSFRHLPALSIVALCAYVTAELLHSKPVYDSLLENMLRNKRKDSNVYLAEHNRMILELVVESGSPADGHYIKDIAFPARTLIVDVRRGEDELVPAGDTRLMAGDDLMVLIEKDQEDAVRRLTEN